MTTYYINEENTGLDSEEKLELMAQLMQTAGHDVEVTHNYGLVNRAECPVSDKEWEDFLVEADDLGE